MTDCDFDDVSKDESYDLVDSLGVHNDIEINIDDLLEDNNYTFMSNISWYYYFILFIQIKASIIKAYL